MSVVMSGTAIAQIISFSLTPVISRLFSPQDFGVFGSFNSFMLIATAVVTLQYSQAVMLPKKDEDAINVFAVSVVSTVLITLLSFVFVLIFSDWLLRVLKTEHTYWLIWFLPLGILVQGINQSFQAWCIRKKSFNITAVSHILRSTSMGVMQIAMGFFNYGGGGLIASAISADGVASVNMIGQTLKKDMILIKKYLCRRKIFKLAVEYRDFPIFSSTQNIMNALSNGLPVLLFSHFYGIGIAGAYAFGMRIIHAPMSLALVALRQVLFQKICETYNRGFEIYPLFAKTTFALFAISLIPSVILILFAPQVFTLVFGDQWLKAGEYVRWLVLWMLVSFANVPSILFARVLRKQKQLFFYELIQLVIRILCLTMGGLFLSPQMTIILFSMVGMLLNSILILWIAIAIKHA